MRILRALSEHPRKAITPTFLPGGARQKLPLDPDRDVWIGAGTTMARRTLASYGVVESKITTEYWTKSAVDEDEDELGTPKRIHASLA